MGSKGSKKKQPKRQSRDSSALDDESDPSIASEDEDISEKVLSHLPNLAAEIQSSQTDVRIDGVRWEETDRTRQTIAAGASRFAGYSPDVVDFIRRCSTEEEALEIIEFLKERGEINAVHARELCEQLRKHGVRSFGAKKSWGYYEREE